MKHHYTKKDAEDYFDNEISRQASYYGQNTWTKQQTRYWLKPKFFPVEFDEHSRSEYSLQAILTQAEPTAFTTTSGYYKDCNSVESDRTRRLSDMSDFNHDNNQHIGIKSNVNRTRPLSEDSGYWGKQNADEYSTFLRCKKRRIRKDRARRKNIKMQKDLVDNLNENKKETKIVNKVAHRDHVDYFNRRSLT